MRTVAAVVFCSLLLAQSAGAQRSYINHRNYTPPNGEDVQAFFARVHPGDPVSEKPAFVWRHDGTGWYHDPAGTSSPMPTPAPGLIDCTLVNPYDDPANALICGLQNVPTNVPPSLPTFRVGQRYFGGYTQFQMVVLSIARTLEGVEVVTFQWTETNASAAAGDVDACRNDGKGAFKSCGLWLPAQ